MLVEDQDKGGEKDGRSRNDSESPTGYETFQRRVHPSSSQGTGLRNAASDAQQAYGEQDTKDRSMAVVSADGSWRFPTREEVDDPRGCNVIPLVKAKWDVGTHLDKFTISPIAHHRYGDWLDYEDRIKHLLSSKPAASQWQKALFVITNVGDSLASIIRAESMMEPVPVEGLMHYDVLMARITEHFKQFQNLTLLYEEMRFMKQASGESTVAFWERMEKVVRKAGLNADSVAVRTDFVLGLREPEIRERAAINQDWSRQKIISVATHMETSLASRMGSATTLDSRRMTEVCAVQETSREGRPASGYSQHDNCGRIQGARANVAATYGSQAGRGVYGLCLNKIV